LLMSQTLFPLRVYIQRGRKMNKLILNFIAFLVVALTINTEAKAEYSPYELVSARGCGSVEESTKEHPIAWRSYLGLQGFGLSRADWGGWGTTPGRPKKLIKETCQIELTITPPPNTYVYKVSHDITVDVLKGYFSRGDLSVKYKIGNNSSDAQGKSKKGTLNRSWPFLSTIEPAERASLHGQRVSFHKKDVGCGKTVVYRATLHLKGRGVWPDHTFENPRFDSQELARSVRSLLRVSTSFFNCLL